MALISLKNVSLYGAMGALALLVGIVVWKQERNESVCDTCTPTLLPVNKIPLTSPPNALPRKVVVGTTLFSLFPGQRPYVSLDHRLGEVARRLDEIAASAQSRQGRGLDIAVFPELTLNSRDKSIPLAQRALPLEGKVAESLGAMARKHRTYLAVSFNLLEDTATGQVSNASVLFDRQGAVVGIYRKNFCLPSPDGKTLEGGKTPGHESPVFETDFGRVALAICYDMGFDELFESYAAQGAELVLWSSMSPQTFIPRSTARRYGYYIVSSTPRDSAAVFDPLGEISAQIAKEGVLTHEIDLTHRLVHWQPSLEEGQALKKKFGDRVGFHYLPVEDTGIYWSNDPALPIDKMLEACQVVPDHAFRNIARTTRERILQEDREAMSGKFRHTTEKAE